MSIALKTQKARYFTGIINFRYVEEIYTKVDSLFTMNFSNGFSWYMLGYYAICTWCLQWAAKRQHIIAIGRSYMVSQWQWEVQWYTPPIRWKSSQWACHQYCCIFVVNKKQSDTYSLKSVSLLQNRQIWCIILKRKLQQIKGKRVSSFRHLQHPLCWNATRHTA